MKKHVTVKTHRKKLISFVSGFTLIELLIVIVIISALAVTVFIALNPTKRLEDARNAKRITDVESIRNAINQYLVDKGALPVGLTVGMQETQIGTSNGTGIGANNVSCVNTTGSCNATSQACVDLTAPLANYLKSIPKDPKIGSDSATGYSVSVDAKNNITVSACGTETFAQSIPTPTLFPNSYYVSPSGNDSWSGLLPSANAFNTDGPFRTLAKAQSAMETSSTYKTVTIRAGTYSIAGTSLSFNWQDSGETWVPYPKESAIIDGGGSGYIKGAGASNMTFEGLTFQNLGTDSGGVGGLHLDSSGQTIRYNTFLNCNTDCISGGSLTNSLIDSNTINGSGDGGFLGAIVLWYGASNNRITHNLIQNIADEGINISTGASDPAANNNIIDRNILRNTCNANTGGVGTDDCGALYMYDAAHVGTGNQITNNIVDGNGGYTTASTLWTDNWSKAIYLDDGVSNLLVSGNICRGCGEYGIQYHGGDHDTVTNNIFDLSSGGSYIAIYQSSGAFHYGMANNTFTKNIIYSANNFHNPLWNLSVSGGDVAPTNNNNLYYSATNASIPNTVVVDTAPHTTNPAFTNPGAGDYTIPSNSPAYSQINWQTLPTDQGPLSNPFQ